VHKGLAEKPDARQRTYRDFVKGMLKEKKAMKGEMDRRLAYGDAMFIGELIRRHAIAGRLQPIGRPQKQDKQ